MIGSAAKIRQGLPTPAGDVDDSDLNRVLKETSEMAANGEDMKGADPVLEELQKAVAEHGRILQRQEELIKRLREELKGVGK